MSIVREQDPELVVTHPNRDPASAKATRVFMIVLLIISGLLMFAIFFASSGARAGAVPLQIVLALLYFYFAYLVVGWRSGILPVAAGIAIVSGIFAAVSAAGWFNRGGLGYQEPPLPESIIGVMVFGFAVLQFVVAVVALKAFSQQWQVELEVPRSSLTPVAH